MCNLCLPHSEFHHLDDPQSVLMAPDLPLLAGTYTENRPLLIHLTVTGRCYARCAGCVNAVTLGVDADRHLFVTAPDTEPERDSGAVIRLALQHPAQDVVLCFYGGEPLMAAGRMARLVELLDASPVRPRLRYMLITNGELLLKTMREHPRLLPNLWLLAVSIDGREAQHNRVRRGTNLRNIHRNLEGVHDAWQGQVLMWSTLREDQELWDCFAEFAELRSRGLAQHFFWHWAEAPEPYADLPRYLKGYGRDLRRIMAGYLNELAAGRVLSLIHINELLLYLLTGKNRGSSACGVELATNYDIAGGRIYPCADLPPDLALADIAPDGAFTLETRNLDHLVDYKDPLGCYACGVHPYCGGRCPVQAATAGFDTLSQYCALMRLHVDVVQEHLPDIVKWMKKHDISLKTIYNNSAYLAQFTDVTP